MMLSLLMLLFTIILHISQSQWEIHNYNPKANPKAIVHSKDGKARFTILSKNILRLEYDPNGIFEDRASFKIINRYFEQVPAFNSTIFPNNTLYINTSDLELYYTGTGPFDNKTLMISGHTTFAGMQFQYIPSGINISYDNSVANNLYGTIRTLDTINGAISLNCIHLANTSILNESLHCEYAPFGQNGYALLDDSNTTMIDNTTNWMAQPPNSINRDTQDYYFFGFGFDYKTALKEVGSISGNVPMIPRYMLGSLHCYFYDYDAYQLEEIIKNYQIRQIPVDVQVIDMDWHKYGPWGSYTWNYNLFPYPNVTMKWLHKLGVRTGGNLHDNTGIQTSEQYYQQAAKALGVTNGKNIPPNFTDYNYMMVLEDIILAPLYGINFDFWWIDWQEGGETGIYYSNINPTILLNYVRATDNVRNKINQRGFVLSRYGGLGNQRYPHGFSGDAVHTWPSLAFQPYFSATASNVAYSWSHDIRGATNQNELRTRWIQWGVYSSMFRTHGPGGPGRSEPDIWTHDWRYEEVEQYYVQQREELVPYLYNATYNLYENNIALLRPIYYDFVAYPSGIEFEWQYTEYMLGDYMLISPVTNYSGDANGWNLTLQNVWLPPNVYWYEQHSGYMFYFESEKGFTEGKVIQRWMDISEVPIYIKCTSQTIIPVQPFDASQILGRANKEYYDHLRFDIYPTPNYYTPNQNLYGNNRIYEDDGYTMDYLKEKNVWTSIQWQFDINTFRFNANIVSEGNYNGFEDVVENGRFYSIRIYNVFPPKVNEVYCNKTQIKYDQYAYLDDRIASNIEDLNGKYYYDGKTMSLTVNCAKTQNVFSATEIEINFMDSWINDMNTLNGMKGKINRAFWAKENLDNGASGNHLDGIPNSNITIAASYTTLLGVIGDSYQLFKDKVAAFNDIYESAIQETKNLNPQYFYNAPQRLPLSVNLMETIFVY